jgi:FRG domain
MAEVRPSAEELRGRHVKIIRTASWEEFEAEVKKFEDPTRKLWDEVWFRGQADSEWPLFTTLERRAPMPSAVSAYLHVISEIKPAVETFTGATFESIKPQDIDAICREYDRFKLLFAEGLTYMAHLRHGGFPSPLMDWTNSPYVAAYFAFARARHKGDVAIYAYRERPDNMKVSGQYSQIISYGPILKTHKRHFRQQSRYTVCVAYIDGQWHFMSHEGVFYQRDGLNQDLLWKITVPASERMKALRYFDKFNLNEFTLFDTEEGLLEMLATRAIDMRSGV